MLLHKLNYFINNLTSIFIKCNKIYMFSDFEKPYYIMWIHVRVLSGLYHDFRVNIEDDNFTVTQLKRYIWHEYRIPTLRQILIFNGRQLRDHELVKTYAVDDEVNLFLVLTLRRKTFRRPGLCDNIIIWKDYYVTGSDWKS